MNFQEKVLETTADLRARATAFASATVKSAQGRAQIAAKRANGLKGSLAVLTVAGREFSRVARRHAASFIKENSAIAVDAGKDVSALARTTFATLTTQRAAPAKTRKTSSTRKRATRKAA